MEAVQAWWACLGDPAAAADVVARITAEGALLTESATRAGPGPGLVVVTAVTAGIIEAVRHLSSLGRTRILALCTGDEDLPAAETWRLLDAGAADVLAWTPDLAAGVVARLRRWTEVDDLIDAPAVADHLVGADRAWRATLRRVVEVARYTNSPVLITGESGTGKELLAKLVHELDPRPGKGSLVVVDCTTVVPTLSGSEFFGHERGAFTGAEVARDGAFALANGGTLFLDEVGELSVELQSELLRVVQEGTYKRVGSNRWQPTSFRLVCATNRPLSQEQAAGRFRRDFYYRIAATTVRLPALRERPGDTLPLFLHFLAELQPDHRAPDVDPLVRDVVLRREYPGNVRDLRQFAHRLHHRHVGPGPISVGDVPEEDRPSPGEDGGWSPAELEVPVRRALAGGFRLRELREAAADVAVRLALEESRGNLRAAAAQLGVTDRALQMRRAGWREELETQAAQAG